MKSKYQSGKSVGKNQTVPISADDPRLAWNKIGQTKARQGAEIDIIGLDGKSLVLGGTKVTNPTGGTAVDKNTKKQSVIVPPSNGKSALEIDTDTISLTPVSNVVATWSGENLVINFDWDYSNPANSTVNEFVVELVGEGVTQLTPYGSFHPNFTQQAQTLTVTKEINEKAFVNFTVDITAICVYAKDALYNFSEKTCAQSIPTYVLSLPTPVINVSAIQNGYSVSYTSPTSSIYDAIEISEYESSSSTEPTGVPYIVTFWDRLNPANIIVPNTNPRWVKARFSSHARKFTDYSAAQKVTPTSPVSIDNTPPNEMINISAVWSGDDIIVTFTPPALDAGVRIQIQLTASNELVGYFYRFPSGTLAQSIIITKKDLFDQFGAHYSSFSGILRSIDSADNRSSGVSFNVPLRSNPLTGVTPTFTVVPFSNAYSVNFTLPSGASYAEVYAKHTPWVGDPTDDTYVVYSGLSPAVITDIDYTTVYIKLRYYDDFGNTSSYSAEGSTTPLNPGEITSFENPITFGANAVIYAGVSPTSGTRTLFKQGGIFAYDGINTSPSTQIISNATDGTPTFITTQAQIADWQITETKIENTLSGTPSKYTGLSATGPYAFWAGSDVSGGNSSADFTVTPGGAVTAKNIRIIGNGTNSDLMSVAGLFTIKNDGSFTATSASISGSIYASSGMFTGKLGIGPSGGIYSGTLIGDYLSGPGFALTSEGLVFNSSTINSITSINGSTGYFITKSANIGGWDITDSSISKTRAGQGKIDINSSNGYISVTNSQDSSKKAGIASSSTNASSAFWAGGSDPDSVSNPFRVTFDGKLYATDAEISGIVNAKSGSFGEGNDGFDIGSDGIYAKSIFNGNIGAAIVDLGANGFISVGQYDILTTQGLFVLTESTYGDLISVDSISQNGRMFLGYSGQSSSRQVQVARSAQIAGSTENYLSGGLRNMFTIGSTYYYSSIYSSDAKTGDVLLVWE